METEYSKQDVRGFVPEAISPTDHLGVFGMRERAEMLAGNLVIERAPGKGITIIVEVNHVVSVADRR